MEYYSGKKANERWCLCLKHLIVYVLPFDLLGGLS